MKYNPRFLVGMGGDPMTVSSEYLDLVKLTADFDIEIGDDADSSESGRVFILYAQ